MVFGHGAEKTRVDGTSAATERRSKGLRKRVPEPTAARGPRPSSPVTRSGSPGEVLLQVARLASDAHQQDVVGYSRTAFCIAHSAAAARVDTPILV